MPRLVASEIALALKERIEAGEWSDGRRVPPERELAAEFGVARNTIRRALVALADSGMILRHVGRGTYVAPAADPSMLEAVSRMAGSSPADMMEVRLLLEPAAAASAATTASAAEINAVREAHDAACNATDMPEFEHWDAEFHHRIFGCCRNELLREIHNVLRMLRNQAPWFDMKQRSFSEERRQRYCTEHAAILEAILRRDPSAARSAMQAHLVNVEQNLLGRQH
ncbi:FadR/GntR family transcriptional regulator [Rhodoligotrophos defluvii]|uniref:FadR/GntR family transcriptional regulator n=1 Tax=Rhodoligotrophos defluvii TaxID=2561934 RepID=UPI0010CA1940|nr:FCD domain-containing protein [Rhodoligotrophos defluvii]